MSNEITVSKLDEIIYKYRNRKDTTASEATTQIKNLIAESIPEKNNHPHKMFDNNQVEAYADGFDQAIDTIKENLKQRNLL